MNYKDTLNLPHTDFPMKANLAKREPDILKKWDDLKLYQAMLNKRQGQKSFILADGPPYANGPIHLGTATNKILKDFVVKSKQLSGFYTPYVPGWDCHGLPIELNVEKKYGKPGVKIDPKSFRQKCREYASTQIDLQREAFVRLGVIGEWENPYLTMDYSYEANIVRSLAKIVEKGSLKKGYKPVHWCLDCGSALAEAEVEYRDKTSSSIYVAFPIAEKGLFPELTSIVIWTTTPWTLPGNQAVCLHPDHNYVRFKLEGKSYIVAEELLPRFANQLGIETPSVVETFVGKTLKGAALQHPFFDLEVPILMGHHVTLEAGTGCVHTAPAHGQDDFEVWRNILSFDEDDIKKKFPYFETVKNYVDGKGVYISEAPALSPEQALAGIHVNKITDLILEILKQKGRLVYQTQLTHSYPHCWRHRTPLIFRATQQWFVSMDENNLRTQALKEIEKVSWIPSWGQARIEGMVADRPDWCVSRQRTWGVPMCLFVHRETGDLHPDSVVLMEQVAKRIEEKGIEAWFELSAEELLGSQANDYEKALDTLDVWFDSGVSHFCVLEQRDELRSPADLYLEGSDQHRGWFQSSLLTSVAMNQRAPYEAVLTHGFIVDADGRKMSKSLGNTVFPEKVVNQWGADILRLWVASADYRSEMVISDDILKQTSDIYRRIRNTARFLLSNLNGFDTKADGIAFSELVALDQWIVIKAKQLQEDITKAYESYQFPIVYQKIHHFCSIELGSFYLDVIKDRQYTGKHDGLPRRSAQTAMYYLAEALVRWIAPILPFTAEEIWDNLPNRQEASVFLDQWYSHFPKEEQSSVMDENFWQTVITVRNAVNKTLEEARAAGSIGSGLEAEVLLYCDADLHPILLGLKDELRFVLITSRAELRTIDKKTDAAKPTELSGLFVEVIRSPHEKCERCWHRREDTSADKQYPGICLRCVENIKEGSGELRQYA